MTLKRIKFSDFINSVKMECNISDLTVNDISGISCDKNFFSPARQISDDTSRYKIVPAGAFACNLLHVGRDGVFPVAFNSLDNARIVSPNYHVFYFVENKDILKEYFWMMLLSDEIDRYFWYNTEASITDRIDWNTFCNTELTVPDLSLQKKFSEIFSSFSSMTEIINKSVEKIEKFRNVFFEMKTKNAPRFELGNFIELSEESNEKNEYGPESLFGISKEKLFVRPMTNIRKVNLRNFFIARPGYFAYSSITSRNDERLSVAFNRFDCNILVSNRYRVFKISTENLLEKYLYYYLTGSEFDRYARYNSWGCAREELSFESLCSFKIPLPTLETQKKIVSIIDFCELKKQRADYYKKLRKDFCSVLYKNYSAL